MQVNAQVAQQGLSYKWLVAIVVILGAFMSVLDQTVVNIAIHRLQNAFRADIHSVQWVVTAYLLTQGAITPTAPYLANNVGIKRSFILSLIAFTLGSLLCGLSWSLPMLILFRVVQGLGGAVLLPLAFTMLFREFAPGDPWHSHAAGPRAGSHSRRLHCDLCQLAVDLFHQHSHWYCRCDPCHPVLTRGSCTGTQSFRPARLHHCRLRSGCTALRVLGNDDCWLGIGEGDGLPVQRGALVDRLYRHRDHHGPSRWAAAA